MQQNTTQQWHFQRCAKMNGQIYKKERVSLLLQVNAPNWRAFHHSRLVIPSGKLCYGLCDNARDRQTDKPTNQPTERERERDDFNILRKGCADKRRAHSTYWVCTNAKDECFCAVFVCENCFYSSTSPSLYSFTCTEYVSQPEVKAQLWLRSVLTHIAQRAQFLSSETFVCCTSKIIYICNSLLGLHILHHKFTAASDSEQAMNGGGSWQLQLHAQAATQNNIYIFAFSDTKYEIFERFFFVGLFCFSACQKRFAWLRFCDCGISHV